MPELHDQLSAALADRYAIERQIGVGGMATVYLARDLKHDRLVAVKVLNPELGAVLGVERFLAEIKVTANLQHPNLLPLFDSGAAAGLLFYVMPYVEGETLRGRLEREKQLPVDETVRIGAAIAGALDYAHKHGVIHRDLKPENILLQHGQPLIADFGIALAVTNAGGARVTQTGLSLGTPHYMSPEQATGDRVIDGRSDLYSLGALLYEMLTGDPPHTGSTTQSIVAKVLTETPPRVRVSRPNVPEHVDEAIARSLEKVPADRWETARELADALTGRVVTTTRRAGTAAMPSSQTSKRALRVWQGIALAAVAIAAATLGKAAFSPRPATSLALARQLTFDGTVVGTAISPDGMWLAYVTDDCLGLDHSCTYSLNVREVDGAQSIRIVSWPYIGRMVKWSPDGSSMAFIGAEPGQGATSFFVAPRLGGSTRRLGPAPLAFTFAADGRELLAVEGSAAPQLVRYDVTTGARGAGAALPAGMRFTDMDVSAHRSGILATATITSSQRVTALLSENGALLDSIVVSNSREPVRWSAAGDAALAFYLGPGVADDLMRIPVDGDRFGRGTPEVLLGQVPTGYRGALDVSETGRAAVIVHPMLHVAEMIRLDRAGGNWTPITRRTGYLAPRSASPDGATIAAAVTDNLGDNIYLLPVDGGTPRAVTSVRGARSAPLWSADGRRLVYTLHGNEATSGIAIADAAGGAERLVVSGWLQAGYAWRGSDRLLVGNPSIIRLYDTSGTARDSIPLPDSLRMALGASLHHANTDGSQWVFLSENGSYTRLDVDAKRLTRVPFSAAEGSVAGVGDDGTIFAVEHGSSAAGSTSSRDRLVRISPGTGSRAFVMNLPVCNLVVVTARGTVALCDRRSSRPDVWLVDAPGRSGW